MIADERELSHCARGRSNEVAENFSIGNFPMLMAAIFKT